MTTVNYYYWKELAGCVDFIERKIEAGDSYSQITKGLQGYYGTRFERVRINFGKYLPCSINKYIKRRLLTEGYFFYKRNPGSLNSSSSYHGIKSFRKKFKSEFSMDVNGECGRSELQPAFDVKIFEGLYCSMAKMPVLDSFKFRSDHVDIDIDAKQLLVQFLSFKTYILPDWFKSRFAELETEEKVLFLESTLKAIEADGNKEIKFTFDEVMKAFTTAKLYDFDSPSLLYNGYFVYVPGIPEYLHETYMESFEDLLPAIKTTIPYHYLSYSTKEFLDAVSESTSFAELQDMTGIVDARELIWTFLTRGYLRYV